MLGNSLCTTNNKKYRCRSIVTVFYSVLKQTEQKNVSMQRLIFVLIKNQPSIWLYTYISMGSTFFSLVVVRLQRRPATEICFHVILKRSVITKKKSVKLISVPIVVGQTKVHVYFMSISHLILNALLPGKKVSLSLRRMFILRLASQRRETKRLRDF